MSCDRNEYKIVDNLKAEIYITKVQKAKYSKIQGYFYWHGIKLEVTNGNSGYHYKTYNLKEGDVIKANIIIYQQIYSTTDPYKDDIILSTSDIKAEIYEIH